MKYEMFVKELVEQLEQRIDDVVVDRTMIEKVNREVDGITIRPIGSSIAPVFYLEDLYERYRDGVFVSHIAQMIADKVRELMNDALGVPHFSKESAMDSLYCAVINVKDNEKLLQTVPHRIVEDLAVIPRFRVNTEGSFLVHNDICSCLEMTEEEILEVAQANTDKEHFVCVNMSELLFGVKGTMGSEPFPMYVLTNQSKVNGAVAIASKSALRIAYETIGGDFYILPSSRHELILVLKNESSDVDALKNMVCEVNSTVLHKEDKLSDNVYFYNGTSQRVCIAR